MFLMHNLHNYDCFEKISNERQNLTLVSWELISCLYVPLKPLSKPLISMITIKFREGSSFFKILCWLFILLPSSTQTSASTWVEISITFVLSNHPPTTHPPGLVVEKIYIELELSLEAQLQLQVQFKLELIGINFVSVHPPTHRASSGELQAQLQI